jgi:transposase
MAIRTDAAPSSASLGTSNARKGPRSTGAAQEVYREADRPRRPLTALQAARLLVMRAADRGTWEREYLARLFQADESLARTAGQVDAFCAMLRHRQGHQLPSWLEEVEQHGEHELQAFARNLRKEEPAVQAGLTLPWNNGPTEGFIHRLKLLKRQAYGRAGVSLLKRRLIADPAA